MTIVWNELQQPINNPLTSGCVIRCERFNGYVETWELPSNEWSWDRWDHEILYRGGCALCYWKQVEVIES